MEGRRLRGGTIDGRVEEAQAAEARRARRHLHHARRRLLEEHVHPLERREQRRHVLRAQVAAERVEQRVHLVRRIGRLLQQLPQRGVRLLRRLAYLVLGV